MKLITVLDYNALPVGQKDTTRAFAFANGYLFTIPANMILIIKQNI